MFQGSELLEDYWTLPEEEILSKLGTSPEGLSSCQAEQKLGITRAGALQNGEASWAGLLWSQFNNPIAWLLSISAVLSYYLDDPINAVILLVIIGLSGLLGFWQEFSAANTVRKLIEVIETKASVLRDGTEVTVRIADIVPGDVVQLKAGSVIPGDCRLLASHELHVNESTLTGEFYPIEKSPGICEATAPVARRTNSLFLGTHVVSGLGKGVVLKTGGDTEFGRISRQLQSSIPVTAFEKGIRRFGKLLLVVTILLAATVCVIHVAFERPLLESVLFSLALAVGMTPQLLPAITSVVLATGAKAMAREKVIVKRLLSIENFGGMNVLCCDKTGTLTTGQLSLRSALNPQGLSSDQVLQWASINATLQKSFSNPIDQAICLKTGSNSYGAIKLDELPYDFSRKRLSLLVERGEKKWIVTKGAVESILQVCQSIQLSDESTAPLSERREETHRLFHQLSEEGYRVLGIAIRPAENAILSPTDESEMIFIGFLVFQDTPKPGISETLEELKQLGIQIKMITGDNRIVAQAIAKQVGLRTDRIVIGPELGRIAGNGLCAEFESVEVFAEIEPEQKQIIVSALQNAGHIVGFLGDGINDAPALHVADVGISVESAVDVAKEAAQIVLLEQDLHVLRMGVLQGRRTLANTLKYIFVSISANFGYMLSMALASIFLPFIPLMPVQILLVNLMADFPAMAMATDSVDKELVKRPRTWDIKSIAIFMTLFGMLGTISDLITFYFLLRVVHAEIAVFQTTWFIVSIMTGLLIMLTVRTQRPFFLSQPGRLLLFAVLSVAVATIALVYSPFAQYFELVSPTPQMLLLVVGISAGYAVAIECTKLVFYRWIGQRDAS